MSIEERVARLERGARWWRRMTLVLLAALGAVVLMGQANDRSQTEVKAEQFSLIDGDGIRAYLASRHGDTLLTLDDPGATGDLKVALRKGGWPAVLLSGGGQSASLVITEKGPTLALMGTSKRSGVFVGVVGGQQPFLTLDDENGIQRAKLALSRDGSPSLKMYDANGDVIWQAPR